ncbi:hypothetical protein BHE74_00016811 [Ensete ventricosum]|nr:hypothetical protein BHE74_00016811 [Ensete ventricosum]
MGTRLECVGSSPRVLGACQDSSREFAGRRPSLVKRLSEVAEKLVGSCKGLQVDLRRLDRLGRWLYRPYPVLIVAFDGCTVGIDDCTTRTRIFRIH